jgi:transposase
MTYEPFGEAYELVARAEAEQVLHRSRVRGAVIAGSKKTLAARPQHQALVARARACIAAGWERKDLAGVLARSFRLSPKQVRRVLQAAGILSKKNMDA